MPRVKRKVLHPPSMVTFLRPMPSEQLMWLIKVAADELAERQLAQPRPSARAADGTRPTLQPHGRTLR